MVLRIVKAEVSGPHLVWLSFNDGTEGEIDVRPLLNGPIFEPLADLNYFARAVLDPVCGTLVWPNGADFAPEALRARRSRFGYFVTHSHRPSRAVRPFLMESVTGLRPR